MHEVVEDGGGYFCIRCGTHNLNDKCEILLDLPSEVIEETLIDSINCDFSKDFDFHYNLKSRKKALASFKKWRVYMGRQSRIINYFRELNK